MELNELEIPTVKLHIGHRELDSGSGGTFEQVNPVSNELQAIVPLAGHAEIHDAVDTAVAAFSAWRETDAETRRDLLLNLARLIQENADQFARMAALDGGIPTTFGRVHGEWACEWIKYYAGWCDKVDGQLHGTFTSRRELSYSAPEPYGVVGIINTWNGPLVSLGMKAAPALAAGNCIIVKPSELVPFASNLFAKVVKEAGFPDGVVSVLSGNAEAGEALVSHPEVELISFTGGPTAARKILTNCAEQMKPSIMELGGKSANLIFPDADIEAACERATANVFGILSGQGCALPTRLLVHTDVYDEVLERITNIAASYKVGDPFDPEVVIGPMINAAACDRVMGMLERVRELGNGNIVLGGNRCSGELAGQNFIEATIIADVDPESEIAQVEVFGPVLVVMKFHSEEEAVRLANNTKYGLAAHVESNDLKRCHVVADKLKTGSVFINGGQMIRPHNPFGGLGISGNGKEGGRAGIDEFLRYKAVVIGGESSHAT